MFEKLNAYEGGEKKQVSELESLLFYIHICLDVFNMHFHSIKKFWLFLSHYFGLMATIEQWAPNPNPNPNQLKLKTRATMQRIVNLISNYLFICRFYCAFNSITRQTIDNETTANSISFYCFSHLNGWYNLSVTHQIEGQVWAMRIQLKQTPNQTKRNKLNGIYILRRMSVITFYAERNFCKIIFQP